MPKTGGTFVTTMLKKVHRGRRYGKCRDTYAGSHITKHQDFHQLDKIYQEMLILTTVRNPYDYYVSLYEFNWWKSYPNTMFIDEKVKAVFPSYPELTFSEFIQAIDDWSFNPYVPQDMGGILTSINLGNATLTYFNYFLKNPWEIIDYIKQKEVEKKEIPVSMDVSPLIRNWFIQEGRSEFQKHAIANFHFINMHNLNMELYDFLLNLGYKKKHIEFIKKHKKIVPHEGGRSSEQKWEKYYSEEQKKLVREKSRHLFIMFPEYDDSRSDAI